MEVSPSNAAGGNSGGGGGKRGSRAGIRVAVLAVAEGHAQQAVEMLNITGAGAGPGGAQPPMRSHWKLRPGPQHTKTASSNASATGQTQQAAMQALQSKHSHSKQQSKRHKANSTATATCCPPCTCAACSIAPDHKHCLREGQRSRQGGAVCIAVIHLSRPLSCPLLQHPLLPAKLCQEWTAFDSGPLVRCVGGESATVHLRLILPHVCRRYRADAEHVFMILRGQ